MQPIGIPFFVPPFGSRQERSQLHSEPDDGRVFMNMSQLFCVTLVTKKNKTSIYKSHNLIWWHRLNYCTVYGNDTSDRHPFWATQPPTPRSCFWRSRHGHAAAWLPMELPLEKFSAVCLGAQLDLFLLHAFSASLYNSCIFGYFWAIFFLFGIVWESLSAFVLTAPCNLRSHLL